MASGVEFRRATSAVGRSNRRPPAGSRRGNGRPSTDPQAKYATLPARFGPASGSALLIVLVALLALSAMGLGLVLLAMTETLADASRRRAAAVMYAAEAGIERVIPDLLRAPDWDAVLDGRLRSGFLDGASSGSRPVAGGRSIDLDELVNQANCGQRMACSTAALDAATEGRPWGVDNPRWRLFAHGPLALLSGGTNPAPSEYVVVLVGDDPAENDHDPQRDGRAPANPGAGLLAIRAEAFGPDGAHRVIEAIAARGTSLSRGGGYMGQRGQGGLVDAAAVGDAVQVPGAALSRSEMSLDGGVTGR